MSPAFSTICDTESVRTLNVKVGGLVLEVRPGTWDSTLGRIIIENDEYQIRCLKKAGKDIRRIVDIGAHIGCFARLASELWPDAEVLAYEPDEENFELLRRNMRGHKARLVRAAVVGREGELVPFECYRDRGAPVNTGAGRVAETGTHYVKAVRPQWGRVDVLKLDCEGLEGEILEYAAAHGMLDEVGWVRGEWHGAENRRRVVAALSDTHEVHTSAKVPQQGYFIAHSRRRH